MPNTQPLFLVASGDSNSHLKFTQHIVKLVERVVVRSNTTDFSLQTALEQLLLDLRSILRTLRQMASVRLPADRLSTHWINTANLPQLWHGALVPPMVRVRMWAAHYNVAGFDFGTAMHDRLIRKLTRVKSQVMRAKESLGVTYLIVQRQAEKSEAECGSHVARSYPVG